MVNNHML